MTPNNSQKAAAESTDKNILVVAGPGSGKTFTLVERINFLLNDTKTREDVVAITFTNQAANEIQKRIGEVEFEITSVFVGTLHAYALRFLQRYSNEIGFKQGITVIPADVAEVLVRRLAIELGFKGTAISLFEALHERLTAPAVTKEIPQGAQLVAATWYGQMLQTGTLDFDGILYWFLRALRSGVGKFNQVHLLVDEYQDAADIDVAIYERMPCKTRFMVGDPDQAIFGFRGGKIQNIMTAANSPGVTVFKLEENYRCADEICKAANSLISHNKNRVQKITKSATQVEGEIERFDNLPTPVHEAAAIARDISSVETVIGQILVEVEPQQFAVLLPTNKLVDEYSKALAAAGINVEQRGHRQMPQDWKAAKLALSFLANPENDTVAALMLERLKGEKVSREAVRSAAIQKKSINRSSNGFGLAADPPLPSIPSLLSIIGIGPESIDRIKASISAMNTIHGVADLILRVTQDEFSTPSKPDGVTVCTMHSAKGREWEYVYLPAFEERICPNDRKDTDMEEQRRLAYVAVTRAKWCLVVSTASKRSPSEWDKEPAATMPSRFLKEMEL